MYRPIKPEDRFFAYEYDAVTQRNQTNSPLLRLPAELRSHIYEFVFESATLKRDLSPTSSGSHRVVLDRPTLTLVCRQTRFEMRPLQNDFEYHRLNIRMEGKHLPDLVDWVGPEQCAKIVQLDMFQSLAGAIRRRVRDAALQGPYVGPWASGGDQIFPALKRVVITYPVDRADDAIEIGESLQTLFAKPDLDVRFKAAKYWRSRR
ncbi:hypothetical protein OPT61_g5423 [Boeremia exigua]|uniref:Uncharacterized protein n=1 Tax=Boeremia exigua TaxID=749465 RepID=A0ACC2IAB6_9PLEO|nr:hypothetical protein OPT61_g5423 [Boeremia exigua]